MKCYIRATLSLSILLLWGIPQEICANRMALIDNAIYTFQNVGDFGFLTSIFGSDYIVTDTWKDIPGQKWKVTKAYLYTSYLLKPTSEGLDSKVSISVFEENGISVVKKDPYTIGFVSGLYWSIIPAEGKFYMLQNLQTEQCMESRGVGRPVGMSPCRNAKSQQWAVHSR